MRIDQLVQRVLPGHDLAPRDAALLGLGDQPSQLSLGVPFRPADGHRLVPVSTRHGVLAEVDTQLEDPRRALSQRPLHRPSIPSFQAPNGPFWAQRSQVYGFHVGRCLTGRQSGCMVGACDQVFHDPFRVGLTRIELVTFALSVQRSNQLSYSPGDRETLPGGPSVAQPDLVTRLAEPLIIPWVGSVRSRSGRFAPLLRAPSPRCHRRGR